jgi:hypothetical protein
MEEKINTSVLLFSSFPLRHFFVLQQSIKLFADETHEKIKE